MADELPDDDVDLAPRERADIDGMYLRLAATTLYELLDVPPDADRRTIRDAYFALSKSFHPDNHYGRRMGPWGPRLDEIFREITRAYEVLSDRNRRAEYDAYLAAHELTSHVSSDMLPDEPLLDEAPVGARASWVAAPSSRPPPAIHPAPLRMRDSLSVTPGGGTVIDPEVAKRNAREALARKLRGGRPSSLSMPAMNVPTSPASGSVPAQRPPRLSSGEIPVQRQPLGGVRDPRTETPSRPMNRPATVRQFPRDPQAEAHRAAKLEASLRMADEAIELGDLIAASNALSLAKDLAPDDPEVRARADDVAQRLAESLVPRYIEQARFEERTGAWANAAASWHKAWLGRTSDASLLRRAVLALLHTNSNLAKCGELARRAVQIAPEDADSHAVLGRVYLAAGVLDSARKCFDQAVRLDPESALVIELRRLLGG
jgi:curved DNA-binding protein CbpA